jgi:GTP pyrophosphokinase
MTPRPENPPGPIATADAARAAELAFPLYGERTLDFGESLVEHARGVAAIVREVRPDEDLVAAANLFAVHSVLREADRWLREHFGAPVAQLVADLRQLRHLSDAVRSRSRAASAQAGAGGDGAAGQEELLRRMLLAMANDLRVVLLRLASRLQTLRYLASRRDPAKRDFEREFARETRALYAPLANRLGLWQLKWELEDYALRFLEPATYQDIAARLEQKRTERERSVQEAVSALAGLLAGAGIAGDVQGRPKHIASIAAKMSAKSLGFERVFDQRALRVVVPEVAHCYEALALVHQRWHQVESEYDDYIARPKRNGYQSLHTVVLDDEGSPIEIQIRTRAMHEQAELGVAAHWRYKEGSGGGAPANATANSTADPEGGKVAWLRRLLDWRSEVDGGASARAQGEPVYALTPQARVVELPAGATAIDFAYHIHTELGHRCRGARVDGALVALTTPLRTGQTVEIVSAKTGGPSRDWLNPELGFLASARSRAKVRQWFHALEHEQSVASGREVVDRELHRLGRTAVSLEDLAHKLGFPGVEELCVAASKEEFHPRSIEHALAGPAPAPEEPSVRLAPVRPDAAHGKGGVLVVGVDSLMTGLARCCRPIPPDPIVGFITRGRGISVHRASCANARTLGHRHPERLIEVQWEANVQHDAGFLAEVTVLANDRQGLLRDISEVLAREKLNVTGVRSQSRSDQAQMHFTMEVPNAPALKRALAQISEVKGVFVARRA